MIWKKKCGKRKLKLYEKGLLKYQYDLELS